MQYSQNEAIASGLSKNRYSRLLDVFKRSKYVISTGHKNLTEYKQITQQWEIKQRYMTGVFQRTGISATSLSNIYLRYLAFLIYGIQPSPLFSCLQPFILHLRINFLSAKSIFNTAASGVCTLSHSLKLQGMKGLIQYARDSFNKKMYNLSHSE